MTADQVEVKLLSKLRENFAVSCNCCQVLNFTD
jgi:hypothetical protein